MKKIVGKVVEIKLKFLAGLLLSVCGFLLAYHLAYYDKVYPQVSLAQAEVSGLSEKQVKAEIEREIGRSDGGLVLVFGDKEYVIKDDDVGLKYDVNKSVDKAMRVGRENSFGLNIVKKVEVWREGVSLGLELEVDEDELRRRIDEIGLSINEDPIEPRVGLGEWDKVDVLPGRNGRRVVKDELKEIILGSFSRIELDEKTVPVEILNVKTVDSRLDEVVETAERLKWKRLELEYDKKKVMAIEGEALLELIGFEDKWSRKSLDELTQKAKKEVNREPEDAVLQFRERKVVEFKAPKDGLIVNKEASVMRIVEGLDELVKKDSRVKVVELAVGRVRPKNEIDDVNSLGIEELIGEGRSTPLFPNY